MLTHTTKQHFFNKRT